MRCRACKGILVTLLLSVLLIPAPAYADVGPKPEATYLFEYEVERVPIESGELWQCEDAACTNGHPLEELGPQRFECFTDNCYAMSYGFADYQKLVIRFADRTRESNVFLQQGFDASFTVTVRGNDLVVEEQMPPPGYGARVDIVTRFFYFLLGAGITLLLELFVAGIFFRRLGHSCWLLLLVVLANVISLPVVWFVFPALNLGTVGTTVAAELFAWLFETLVLFVGSLGRLPLKHALVLALVMNLVSFWVGLLF